MAGLNFDAAGERKYVAGVSKCVLFMETGADSDGHPTYGAGTVWNGIVNITESPSGGEPNEQYADDIMYASIAGREIYGGSIECFTFPDSFYEALGYQGGYGQQGKTRFAIAYLTKEGTDTDSVIANPSLVLHIAYGCLATPSDISHDTINETPEAATMSFDFTCAPLVWEEGGVTKSTASYCGAIATTDAMYVSIYTNGTLPMPWTTMPNPGPNENPVT